MPDALMYLLIAAALIAAALLAAGLAGFNRIAPDEPSSDTRSDERAENADIGHAAAMGSPLDFLFVFVAKLGQPAARVPWWRRWKLRLLALAAIGAAAIISGSRLL